MRQLCLIVPKDGEAYVSYDWIFQPGMVIYQLTDLKVSEDGKSWKEIPRKIKDR